MASSAHAAKARAPSVTLTNAFASCVRTSAIVSMFLETDTSCDGEGGSVTLPLVARSSIASSSNEMHLAKILLEVFIVRRGRGPYRDPDCSVQNRWSPAIPLQHVEKLEGTPMLFPKVFPI